MAVGIVGVSAGGATRWLRFGGSFGLKSVLPAMVPELSYDGFAINEGSVASQALKRAFSRSTMTVNSLL